MREKLSVVIPCYNSAKNIEGVVNDIDKVLEPLDIDYEYVLVNDNSKDNTFAVISSLASSRENIKAINLARNFGQHAALLAGFHYVDGDYVVTAEDDGQTSIELFPTYLQKLQEGYDVATHVKTKDEKRSLYRKLGAAVARWSSKHFINDGEERGVAIVFMARRFVIDELIKYDQPYPYMSGLILRITRNIYRIESVKKSRRSGRSGYNFKKLLSIWLNGFTAFSIKPLRISVVLGGCSAISGIIVALILVIRKLFFDMVSPGWTSLISINLIMFGIVLGVLGMIGEYVGRIYICINGTPQYIVREVVSQKMEDINK